MKIGTAAITVPAITRLGWSTLDLLNRRSPLWTVFMSCSVTTRFGHRYWFHVPRKLNNASAPSVGSHERHRHVAKEAEVADAVDRGRVEQVARQRHEHLPQQEDPERGGEERRRQAR